MSRAIRSGNEQRIAHALESVEVRLGGRRSRLCLPVVDVRKPPAVRLAALRAGVDVPDLDLDAALDDLITDPARCWRRPWLAACATATRDAATTNG